jgi:hypothetical protein
VDVGVGGIFFHTNQFERDVALGVGIVYRYISDRERDLDIIPIARNNLTGGS